MGFNYAAYFGPRRAPEPPAIPEQPAPESAQVAAQEQFDFGPGLPAGPGPIDLISALAGLPRPTEQTAQFTVYSGQGTYNGTAGSADVVIDNGTKPTWWVVLYKPLNSTVQTGAWKFTISQGQGNKSAPVNLVMPPGVYDSLDNRFDCPRFERLNLYAVDSRLQFNFNDSTAPTGTSAWWYVVAAVSGLDPRAVL